MGHNNISLRTNGAVLVILALSLLILPLQWIGAALLAALVHELAHAAAVRLCSGQIYALQLGVSGAAMEIPPMSRPQELFCALAGPLGGLLLLPLAKWLPRTAVCAAFHSLYNLLPVYPLDGGRAVRSICEMLFLEKTATYICDFLSCAVCVFLVVIGFCSVFVWRLGLIPAVAAVLTVFKIRANAAKFPCKAARVKVQ